MSRHWSLTENCRYSEDAGEPRIPPGSLLTYKRKRDDERLHNLNGLVRADQESGTYERERQEG